MRHHLPVVSALAVLVAACAAAPPAAQPVVAPPSSSSAPPPAAIASAQPAPPDPHAWVAASNANAQVLLDVMIAHEPERASTVGLEQADARVRDLSEGHEARKRADLSRAADTLRARMASEADPLVKQDLAILVHAAELRIKASTVREQHEVPFTSVVEVVFGSLHGLLDDRVAAARRPAAVARLKKYAGLEAGTRPLAELARAETTAKLGAAGLMPPTRLAVQKAIDDTPVMLDGLEKLLVKFGLVDYDQALKAFREQANAYADFLRKEVLPKARADFRLAPELYAVDLENAGVEIPPEELVRMGHAGFDAIQAEMQRVAAKVADERHLPSKDYRDVIRALKKDQIAGDAILPMYESRLKDIEAIIRREHLVTLPDRPARIRLATAAETAQQPAPHMSPPRLIGNQGEPGEFVLPLVVPTPPGSKEPSKMDDFTYAAASWTLTAHEARPGHELQFATMVERGVSQARAIYAFNSANVEGWGLYSEYLVYPYMPPEGQLASLLLRLHRAARCFLDPELEAGKQTIESARALLEKDVVLSPAFAKSEVDRYTFRMPGQAVAYFYGFNRLIDTRKAVEERLGASFDLQRFDDAVLAQGLLPPDLMREALLSASAK